MCNNSTVLIRRYLKTQITGDNDFVNNEKEKNIIFDLVKRTIEYGESNSALLVGDQGVGKSAMVRRVLNDLEKLQGFKTSTVVVKLNGLIHTDDKLALKSITIQMCLENEVGDRVFGSFSENLNFLLTCLKSGADKSSKSIIFILDEFDLFCSHHNQTLLYNLFDVAQCAQAPICVLGITCNISVIELLEKRVKSRFSHRKIWLDPSCVNREKQLLIISEKAPIPSEHIELWNKHIKEILDNARVKTALKIQFQVNKSEGSLRNSLIRFVSLLHENKQWPDENKFAEIFENNYKEDHKVKMLQGLSILELCLMISMKHQCEIYDWQPFNFEMICLRYKKFVMEVTALQVEPRSVIMKAYEHISNLEFIMPVGSKLQPEYQMYKLMLTSDQINTAVKLYQGLPTSVNQWNISSLH